MSVQWQKNLKYLTADTYRIWTYTDFVRRAVLLPLFLRLVLVWSMNGFDRVAQLQSPEPTFPLLWLVGFCEQLPNEHFAKPIRKVNFCMERVRKNKDFFFLSVSTLRLFTFVKQTHLCLQTHIECEGWGWFRKRWNLHVSLCCSHPWVTASCSTTCCIMISWLCIVAPVDGL